MDREGTSRVSKGSRGQAIMLMCAWLWWGSARAEKTLSRDSLRFFHLAVGRPLDLVKDKRRFGKPLYRLAVEVKRSRLQQMCENLRIDLSKLTIEQYLKTRYTNVALPAQVPTVTKLEELPTRRRKLTIYYQWIPDPSQRVGGLFSVVLEDGSWREDWAQDGVSIAHIHLLGHAFKSMSREKCRECTWPYPDSPKGDTTVAEQDIFWDPPGDD